MSARPLALITGLLLAAPGCTGPSGVTPTTIAINDSLAAHADPLPVREGALWAGRIYQWKFGDYAVVSSRRGWDHGSTRTNIFNTRTETRVSQKFSFVLADHSPDSAWVNAARNGLTQTREPLNLGHGWFLGSSEVVRDEDNFAATITINRDTTDTWMLLMGVRAAAETAYGAVLTNGVRRVAVVPRMVNAAPLPSVGHEFVENGRSLAAVQYFGMSRVVWLDRTLDARTRLILAAAITALLQNNSQ